MSAVTTSVTPTWREPALSRKVRRRTSWLIENSSPIVKRRSTTPSSARLSTRSRSLDEAEPVRTGEDAGDEEADDGRELEPVEDEG